MLWKLHRDELHPKVDTARGKLVGRSALTGHELVLHTVEALAARIPAGHTYLCTLDTWHRDEGLEDDVPTFEVQWPWDDDGDGLPDRDRILLHWANAVRNRKGRVLLRGCIAPGISRVDNMWEVATGLPSAELPLLARSLPGVTDSRKAFWLFMQAVAGLREFKLEVTE